MKLKYQIAMALTGAFLVLGPTLLHKRAPRFIKQFFTAETDAINLAIFRVVFFWILASKVSVSYTVWFSAIPHDLQFPPMGLAWVLDHLPVNPVLAKVAAVSLLVCCVTAAAGLWARTSCVLCAVLALYVLGIPQFYGKINHYHHLVWFAAILAASPCADVLSVDAVVAAWRRADRGIVEPPAASVAYALPLRFIWLILGAIYFSAGVWKVWTGGYAWALSDNPKIMMYRKWLELGGWRPVFRIDEHPFYYHLGAVATIAFELSFIVIIFFPAIRLLAPIGGVLFHWTTSLFMRIWFWELEFCYVAFVDFARIGRFVARWMYRNEMYVIYDGNCKMCRRTIASLRVFDVFAQIKYVNGLDREALGASGLGWLDPDAIMRDMHAVVGRRAWKGFAAYRALVWRMPLLWPVLPVLYVWPVPIIGRWLYRRVADTRMCTVGTGLGDAPREPARSNGAMRKRQVWATVLVGAFFLDACILTGVGKIQSWPFAGYPTFEDIDPPDMDVISIKVVDREGRTKDLTPILEQQLRGMGPERALGMIFNILGTQDPQVRERRLRTFWSLLLRETRGLDDVVAVQFYRDTLSSLPSRQNENPLKRELMYQYDLASSASSRSPAR